MYEEPGAVKKTRSNRLDQSPTQQGLKAQEMIDLLRRSGYEIRKIDLWYAADMPINRYW